MKRAITGIASLLAVGALAGGLFVGSQAIRQARLATADAVSPSPSDSPTDVPTPTPTVLPSCVPGEGNSCGGSSPIALPPPSPAPPAATPDDTSAGTTGPTGQIQASFVTFSTGEKLGVSVAVLHQSSWVVGASVSVHCTAAAWSDGASGTTALRSAWSVPANGPRPPTQPGAFFWAQISGPGSGATYSCSGTATWSGLSTSFSVTARA